jgi:hypothetical protein
MHAFYVCPPAGEHTDYHAWLEAVIGDVQKPAPKQVNKPLVLIGSAISFIKFFPVVLSREVLKRVELKVYSLQSVQEAARGAGLVIVESVSAGEIARDAEALKACAHEALVVLCVPEPNGKLRPPIGEAFGMRSSMDTGGVKQSEMARAVGLQTWCFVCDPEQMKRPWKSVSASSAMVEQLEQLKRMRR